MFLGTHKTFAHIQCQDSGVYCAQSRFIYCRVSEPAGTQNILCISFFFFWYVFGQPCSSECECTVEFVSLPGYALSVTDKWPNMGNFLVQEVGLIG